MINSAQCRAARGLLAWNQQDLADAAGVGIVTIHQLEAGTSEPRRATLQVIRHAFEVAGVEFIDENGGGPGVRLRKPTNGEFLRNEPNLLLGPFTYSARSHL